jgi:hypothetical protein
LRRSSRKARCALAQSARFAITSRTRRNDLAPSADLSPNLLFARHDTRRPKSRLLVSANASITSYSWLFTLKTIYCFISRAVVLSCSHSQEERGMPILAMNVGAGGAAIS